MKQLMIEGIKIEVERKRIKNMYLKVLPPDGKVHISAPMRMPEPEIIGFVRSRIEWIVQQQVKLKNRHSKEDLDYVTSDEILLCGSRYRLEVQDTNSSGYAYTEGSRFILYARPSSTVTQRHEIINRYYREVLTKQIPGLILKWEKAIGVQSEGYTIRNMKTRWGTCNIRSKRICLNLQLAKKPPKCLEYVIVHELVHLLEGSHNRVFKNYMDHFLPDWKTVRKEMNGEV